MGLEDAPVEQLALEAGEERLAQSVVVGVADGAHRRQSPLKASPGLALVVRNGHARARRVTVGSGTLTVRTPRVNDRGVLDGERQKFTSEILPPTCGGRRR